MPLTGAQLTQIKKNASAIDGALVTLAAADITQLPQAQAALTAAQAAQDALLATLVADVPPVVTPPPVTPPPVAPPPVTPPVVGKAPLFGFYPGGAGNPTQQSALAKQVGVPLGIYVDGTVWDTFPDLDNETSWLSGVYKAFAGASPKLPLCLPFPTIVNGQTLAQGAAGINKGQFAKVGAFFVAAGIPDVTWRVDWEGNGTWYPFSGENDAPDFVTSSRLAILELKTVPGNQFKFAFNPSCRAVPFKGSTELPIVALYPGDDVIDMVLLDMYEETWAAGFVANNSPTASNVSIAQNDIFNGDWGLKAVLAFAEQHAKPFGFGEFGVANRTDKHGVGDDATFIPNAFAIIKACSSGLAIIEYFSGNDGSTNSTLGATFPNATATAPAAYASLLS